MEPAKGTFEAYLDYLVNTANPGGTMSRYGMDQTLGTLEPGFAGNLSAAIQQARSEGIPVGVFSGYRAPDWGVGGYADKNNSLHALGLSVDLTGIGRAGSDTAARWHDIATEHGLYNPYGSSHPKEFNHYQAVPLMGAQYRAANRDIIDTALSGGRALTADELSRAWSQLGFSGRGGGARGAAAQQASARVPVPMDKPDKRQLDLDRFAEEMYVRPSRQVPNAPVPRAKPAPVPGQAGKASGGKTGLFGVGAASGQNYGGAPAAFAGNPAYAGANWGGTIAGNPASFSAGYMPSGGDIASAVGAFFR